MARENWETVSMTRLDGLFTRLGFMRRSHDAARTKNESVTHLEPVRITELMRQCPGKWVAVRANEIVEVRDTMDQLVLALADRDITDATIIRAPQEHESELVGLG